MTAQNETQRTAEAAEWNIKTKEVANRIVRGIHLLKIGGHGIRNYG